MLGPRRPISLLASSVSLRLSHLHYEFGVARGKMVYRVGLKLKKYYLTNVCILLTTGSAMN